MRPSIGAHLPLLALRADANLNTAVVQASAVSQRPLALDGKVIAFTSDTASVEQSAICSAVGFERCEATTEGTVRIHFQTHEQALHAIEVTGLPFPFCLEYNGRPYEERGWVRSRTLRRTAKLPLASLSTVHSLL